LSDNTDKMIEFKKDVKERAIVAGMFKPGEPFSESETGHFDEIKLLADTAGAEIVGELSQRGHDIFPTYYIGTGKAEELKEMCLALEPDMVIFDNDLSPAQAANLEKLLEIKVIDRSGLILDIFAQHARTREAKTQVELAQLKYILPRLTRQWTHLSRQQGGIGLRGPGETQLEVDRRSLRKRINHLTAILDKIDKQRNTGRQQRGNIFKVSLVGYTNAGKSTLMNALCDADVPVENKLFKTLDSTTRQLSTGPFGEIVLSDTVGFIRSLPHDLVASFKSTLDEVRNADLLLHVVDVSNPEWEKQAKIVGEVLAEIESSGKETFMIFNKIDLTDSPSIIKSLEQRYDKAFFVSAEKNAGTKDLKEQIISLSRKDRVSLETVVTEKNADVLKEIYRYGHVHETIERDGKTEIRFTMEKRIAKILGLMKKD